MAGLRHRAGFCDDYREAAGRSSAETSLLRIRRVCSSGAGIRRASRMRRRRRRRRDVYGHTRAEQQRGHLRRLKQRRGELETDCGRAKGQGGASEGEFVMEAGEHPSRRAFETASDLPCSPRHGLHRRTQHASVSFHHSTLSLPSRRSLAPPNCRPAPPRSATMSAH